MGKTKQALGPLASIQDARSDANATGNGGLLSWRSAGPSEVLSSAPRTFPSCTATLPTQEGLLCLLGCGDGTCIDAAANLSGASASAPLSPHGALGAKSLRTCPLFSLSSQLSAAPGLSVPFITRRVQE